MERQTRAHFHTQGVPVFAHPILPRQFVRGVHELIGDLPKRDQAATLSDLVNHFRQDLRPGIAQELELHSPAAYQRQGAAVVARELNPALRSMVEPSLASFGDQRQAVAARQASPFDSHRQADDRNDGAPMRAQPLSFVDANPGMMWGGSTPPHRPNANADEETRQRAADNASHLADYSDGRVAQTVDEAIAATTWFERRVGDGGAKVRGKGRYIWTRYGWVDLQHVISAATATPSPGVNLILGVGQEGLQWIQGQKSGGKREDYLSNWIGARALARQQRVGGTIGQAVAYVLAQYRPMTRKQADEFLRNGGQREDWP
jgi:hypothetical protein